MMAAVGSETSFDNGRQQLHLLAGLEVTAKAVERHAEAIGADIVKREQTKRELACVFGIKSFCSRCRKDRSILSQGHFWKSDLNRF